MILPVDLVSSNRIGPLLHRLPELQALTKRVEYLSALQSVLAEILPAQLAGGAAPAVSETGELVLYADNGAVAAKLKQLTPRIMVFLTQRGIEVTGIRVQVQVSSGTNPLPQKQISMSPAAGEAVHSLVSRVADPGLKAALARLARRGKGSDHEQ